MRYFHTYPISCHCSHSITPENIRKPVVFYLFREHRKRPGAQNVLIWTQSSSDSSRNLLLVLLLLLMHLRHMKLNCWKQPFNVLQSRCSKKFCKFHWRKKNHLRNFLLQFGPITVCPYYIFTLILAQNFGSQDPL